MIGESEYKDLSYIRLNFRNIRMLLSKYPPIFEFIRHKLKFIRQTRQIEHKKAPSYKGTMR
jgi:hypothetical protein